ncbi:protein [Escherichia coli]|nr:protein [Escherichia coli]
MKQCNATGEITWPNIVVVQENFAEDREKASDAGRKGGQHSGGNFKNDPQRASEAGKKGGQQSGGNKSGKS